MRRYLGRRPLPPLHLTSFLNRSFVEFAGANAHYTLYRSHKNLTVTDFSGVRRFHNGIHAAVHVRGLDDYFDFDFRQKINHIFRTPVQLGMAFLTTEAFHLGDGQAGGTAFSESLSDFLEFERLNDGSDLFHEISKEKTKGSSPKTVGNRITPIFAKTSGA